MIKEENRYKSDTLRITGIALMTPFGKMVIDFFSLRSQCNKFELIIYFFISLLLFMSGIIAIEKGREFTE